MRWPTPHWLSRRLDAWAALRTFDALVRKTDNVRNVSWLGHPIWQYPLDAWVLQEVISELRPDLIIETGTYEGGSALYFASLCDLLGHGEIVSIDIAPKATPEHRRITYITNSSIAEETLTLVRKRIEDLLASAFWSSSIQNTRHHTSVKNLRPTLRSSRLTATCTCRMECSTSYRASAATARPSHRGPGVPCGPPGVRARSRPRAPLRNDRAHRWLASSRNRVSPVERSRRADVRRRKCARTTHTEGPSWSCVCRTSRPRTVRGADERALRTNGGELGQQSGSKRPKSASHNHAE